ncbi:MAG: molybdopterin oxidoreductase [Panacagrimonas sp.]|nr:molybdopterin-dependent oxidoreductase [Panacagrimonas sp.]MCC2657897.1 molybdopterin oxidoreductase [Panacagrimonas sp.]
MNSATVEDKKIFCGICEASCGLVATVRGDEILKLRGDPDHPQSEGFICPKGASFGSIVDDPDRVLRPLQRQPDGTFREVEWSTALDDIGARLRRLIGTHGSGSVGVYLGNPNAWNYGAFLFLTGLAAALKTRHYYTASSGDINNYWTVGELLYGHNLSNPFPDIQHTDFMIVLGSNLVVTHGSMMTVGRVKEKLDAIVQRGGRVVVIDPRHTETARQYEWQPLKPDGDPWLLAAMLKTLFDEKRVDEAALREQTTGGEKLPALLSGITQERVEAETGMRFEDVQRLARDFASAKRAVIYGRCGASLGPFSTLTKYLIDAFNIATGNFDRRGGFVFGRPMVDIEIFTRLFGLNGYDRWRTRVDNMPEVFGTAPLASMAREITTPGKGQMRALIVGSGNIATTACASGEIGKALGQLELLVSLDPYVTETNAHAHYILPPTLWIERDGIPIFTQMHNAVPYAQWVPPAVPPRGDTRDDWWILDQIAKRIRLVPAPSRAAQWLGRIGIRLSPATIIDLFLRLSREGDWFGLRPRGLSRKKLCANPGGVKMDDAPPVGVLRKRVHHRDRKVHLHHALFETEMRRMIARTSPTNADYPLRLVSMRELQSQNSWLHNSPRLMTANRTHRLRMHPADAERLQIRNEDLVTITSRWGRISSPVQITDEMTEGVVALPQSWGHRGGWKHAVAAGGSNYNRLTSSAPGEIDQPSGNAVLNGIAVRVERIAQTDVVAA